MGGWADEKVILRTADRRQKMFLWLLKTKLVFFVTGLRLHFKYSARIWKQGLNFFAEILKKKKGI